ncbi:MULTISPECIES: hypothetical protein [unclassified Sphingomonas]|uniref:hypothetical protein n=1 Tax=unclassified Sphingomonas TaxID=196159 RepID=UPI001F5883B0|nr:MULTISPECIES: hypothetical protein [unclassified Sphingomonas]
MPGIDEKQKRMHYDLSNVGLRAQATAVGLVQLCIELKQAGLLESQAIERIKSAIGDEIIGSAPRAVCNAAHKQDVRSRLDRLFAGDQAVGSADALAFEKPMDRVDC